ncbi:MAG: hypothetical protein ACPG80_04045, partial [Rickettsiales bacterium]
MQQTTNQNPETAQDAVNVGAAARMRMENGEPSRQPRVELQDVIAVTARLAQVLAQEMVREGLTPAKA